VKERTCVLQFGGQQILDGHHLHIQSPKGILILKPQIYLLKMALLDPSLLLGKWPWGGGGVWLGTCQQYYVGKH